jgi:hypothetical protein
MLEIKDTESLLQNHSHYIPIPDRWYSSQDAISGEHR